MKSIAMWKMPILLGSLGAVLLLSPGAKAQSEVAPDHFDGTDSWAMTHRAQATKTSSTNHQNMMLAQSKHTGTATTAKSSKPAAPATKPAQDSIVVAENRKPAVPKEKQ